MAFKGTEDKQDKSFLESTLPGSDLTVGHAIASIGVGLAAGLVTYGAIRTIEHFANGDSGLGLLDNTGMSLL